MRIWQTGTYPGGAIKIYSAVWPWRSCLAVSLGRGLTVENINLTGDRALIVATCRFNVLGIYVTQNHESTLEVFAPGEEGL